MTQEENQKLNGENQEEKEYKDFISTALRKPRKGIRQQLMAQLLIKANITSDALLKVQSICEVSYMSEKHKDKIDMNLVECASLVSTSLSNTLEHHFKQTEPKHMIRVTWAFEETEENWKKYIEPWQKINLGYYALETAYRYHNHPWRETVYGRDRAQEESWIIYVEELRKEVAAKIEKMPKHRAFFERTGALSLQSFYALRGEFENWATAKLRPIQALVAEEIDPEIYKDVVQLLMKQGRKEEEEAEHEGRMDT